MDDPRSLAEAVYDTSLGGDAGPVVVELLDINAIRTGDNNARPAGRILRRAARAGLRTRLARERKTRRVTNASHVAHPNGMPDSILGVIRVGSC